MTHLRLGNRTFNPPWWGTVLFVVLLTVMLLLGRWQLQRAAEKSRMQAAIDIAMLADPVPVDSLLDSSDELRLAARDYRRVSLQGTYQPNRQFLWDNRTRQGRAGFEVLVPLRLQRSDALVLVNRGWIAPGPSRTELPNVDLPAVVLNAPVSITDFITRPSRGLSGGDALMTPVHWPAVLQYLDYEAIAAALGEPVAPILLEPRVAGSEAAAPDERNGWYSANWEPAASGPAKHYSYAFQWFAMALGLGILFIVVNTRRSDESVAS